MFHDNEVVKPEARRMNVFKGTKIYLLLKKDSKATMNDALLENRN